MSRKNQLQEAYAAMQSRYKHSPIRAVGRIADKDAATHIDESLARMTEGAGNEDVQRQVADLFAAANSGSPPATMQLNALRLEATSNLLIPELRILPAFFEVESLGDADRPVWQNETREEINVRIVSQDGRRGVATRMVKPQREELIDLQELATDPVRYPIRDTVLGNVQPGNSARANLDLARDLAANLEARCLTLLSASFGSWSLTAGNREDRVVVPHSLIKTGNLPLSNDITLDATTLNNMGITRSSRVVNSGSTGLRQEVFDALTWYVTAWGETKPAGHSVEPAGVLLVPSSDVASIANSLTLDGAKGSDIAEQLKEQGFARVPWLGRIYTLVPSATLEPNRLLVPFTKKMGKLYLKPSMDWEDMKSDVRNNFEERSQGKTFGLFAPAHWKPFGLRIRYRS